ncbi:helix-turn-helix domain-containing protein [Kitasatospora terrestris]|uniref:Helix-turn-helix transcriptional regulator n=1 Tax=Kitasatospora terrestris TaxID=258051 RepID=A0ABP9DWS0_9ACTN
MEQPQSGTSGIGQRLRELRQKKGLNQQDLASADISVSYVSLIETGKRAPSEAVLKTLAERVGCSVEYLRTGRDDARVQELELKIAFGDMAMRNGANGEALQSYSEALAAAPFLSDAMVRRARIGQATAFEKLGQLEAAIQMLTSLFEDPASVPGSAEWTQLAVALCRCYRDAGDQLLSVEIGERAMRTLDGLGLAVTDDHIQLGATLISCYQSRGDLTQAHLIANRLIPAAEQTGSRVARGSVYWNAAVVAISQGRIREALTLTERALAMMAESDNVRHQALLKGAYGYLLLSMPEADLERTKELLEESQEALLDVGSAMEQARNEVNLARLAVRLGKPADALAHASRALGLLRNNQRWEAAEARVILARAQFMSGDRDNAETTLRAVERQLGQVPVSRDHATVWRHVGDLWKELGHAAEALSAYENALAEVGLLALPSRTTSALPSERG